MNCEICAGSESAVLETKVVDADRTRRRRKCSTCGHRWTTFEIAEHAMPSTDVAKAARAAFEVLESALAKG